MVKTDNLFYTFINQYKKIYFTESGNNRINIKNDGAAIIEIGKFCTNISVQTNTHNIIFNEYYREI